MSAKHDRKSVPIIHHELNQDECRKLLRKVDRMREILSMEKIDLPQIVVVGEQSVGKSSILESISGIQLPRAQSICTRCPLELRMKHAEENQQEYATIRCQGMNEEVIYDFAQISAHVLDCTRLLTGNDVSISASPIFLTVYRHDIEHDLTLIDLPGIVRTTLAGQSTTVYQEIVSLINQCVQPETSVIIHVIPASTDFATSETIQICQRYDPEYRRQIIVASKIDKYDKNIGEKILGLGFGSIQLPLGCVAVLNRTQEEIDQNISAEEMRRREENFFRMNEAFHDVPKEFLGTQSLVKKLVRIQEEIIRVMLPRIVEKIEQNAAQCREELAKMPRTVKHETDAQIVFHDIIRAYRTAIDKSASGEYEIDTKNQFVPFTPLQEQKWDSRIAYHMKRICEWSANQINQIFSELGNLNSNNSVSKSIKNNYGGGLPNFPSTNIIQQLFLPYQEKIKTPCRLLVGYLEEYMVNCLQYILDKVIPSEASYKFRISEEFHRIIKQTMNYAKQKCMENVEIILSMEERVFTVNPSYRSIFDALRQKHASVSKEATDDVLFGLQAYIQIVGARIIDYLCQLSHYWYIRHGFNILDQKLAAAFTSAKLFELMKESPALEHKRTRLTRTIDAMEKAIIAAKS